MVLFNFCIVLNSGVRNVLHVRCEVSTSYDCGVRRGSVLWSIAVWSWKLPSQEKYFPLYTVNNIKLILNISDIKEMLHSTIYHVTFQHNGLWEVIHTSCFRQRKLKKQIKTGDPKEDIISRYLYANGELSKPNYSVILQRTSLR